MSDATVAHAGHSPHLKHHFDTPSQQFESGKLGMWLFLATELLMFGGLFCAYSIYRGNHPEIFHYGHQFLDVKWGGINTIVLICSSLTMAWAVRAAQLGQHRLLILMLSLTLLCAGGFLAIKYVEYSHKIQHGLMWGTNFRPDPHAVAGIEGRGQSQGQAVPGDAHIQLPPGHEISGDHAEPGPGASSGPTGWADVTTPHSLIGPASRAPAGLADPEGPAVAHEQISRPANAHIFFGIYFAMTGLHGIHVLAGMMVIGALLIGAFAGRFGPSYFTPVDLVGLYWHIVDLIWIFLFPLLYLID